MLLNFFDTLRAQNVPCTLRELIDLHAALNSGLARFDMDEFYLLARTVLVKDEKHYDKFDNAFGIYFDGIEQAADLLQMIVPEDWIEKNFKRDFSEEELAEIESLGGFEELMKKFKEIWAEQKERHEGGKKWIGTNGTSPFGNGGMNNAGMRIGGDDNDDKGQGAKRWDQRMYRNLDDDVELGTRNIKMALRRLRKFAREGADEELDMANTISYTAQNAGMLDIIMRPERRNAAKVLVFFDVGGSMDPYVKVCEELFSAARTEFKHLEYFYFHNFIYESCWKDNRRRTNERMPTIDLLHKFQQDYRVLFVGDATMAPYEITNPGGSIEHWNDEPGMVWLQRIADTFPKLAWLNPVPQDHWEYSVSVQMTKELVEQRMFPMTLAGLEDCMTELTK